MNNPLDKLIQSRAPALFKKSLTGRLLKLTLTKLFRYEETKTTLDKLNTLESTNIFHWLSDRYTPKVSISGIENIPEQGPALIVANHPMGPADAIALVGNLKDIRDDTYIFANKLFIDLVPAFDECMAPLYWDKKKEVHSANKRTLTQMITFINKEMLGVYFPSGRVAKFRFFYTKEYPWHETPLNIADRYNLRIIPIHIKSRNSLIFYLSRLIHKNLRDLSQIYEVINKKNKHIQIYIGSPIIRKDLNSQNSIAIKELEEVVEKLR